MGHQIISDTAFSRGQLKAAAAFAEKQKLQHDDNLGNENEAA
jgi:hypothetical protein